MYFITILNLMYLTRPNYSLNEPSKSDLLFCHTRARPFLVIDQPKFEKSLFPQPTPEIFTSRNLTNSDVDVMRLRSQDSEPITFTLKPRNKSIRLSKTEITASPDETQHDLSKRIAEIARLPIARLRVEFESASKRVLDKRVHRDSPPKVEDILDTEGTVLIVKDLGSFPLPGVVAVLTGCV